MTNSDKPCHMFLVALALITSAAQGHPLEDAAERATALCMRVAEGESLEYCGTEMGGRSPEHSAARIAVRHMLEARNAFMGGCQERPRQRCLDLADWYIGSGMSRVLNAPPIPRSDARR